MALYAFVLLPFALGIFQDGSAALVQTQETVMATAGEEVCLRCQLMEYKEVQQVTWKKSVPDGEKTMTTYSRFSGERVNPDFQDKVEFKIAELLRSSIVIKEVTEQDEGCYRCLFNTWPDVDLSGLTCIRLYELYGPVLHIRGQNSTRDVVVSCSASGRPPPSMEITVPQQDLHLLKTSSDYVLNNNSTVTVTMTAVLSRFHQNSVPVGCAAQVLPVPQTKVFRMISEPAAEGESELGNISNSRTLIIVLVVLAVSVGLSVALFFLYKFKKQTSLPHVSHQMIETSSAADRDPQRTEASMEENVQIRFRSSPEKNPESVDVSPLPVTPRRL